jgi:PDZ domain-containing secreted protein
MTAEDNFKTLCNLATNLVGLPKGSLSIKNRKIKYQVPRAVVSMIARIEDKTHREVIAKVLDRNRTSINHYERTHSANYSSFPYYRDTFNKIYNAYVDIKESKKTFIDMYHLKDHLRKNGVRNSSKHQTIIRITSGKLGTDIKVSYRDHYNQYEICKLALQDYQHEMKIITL